MFSRAFSKGFYRQGFPGWYRGLFTDRIPSKPGTFSLSVQVAGLALTGTTAGLSLEKLTPLFTLERQF